MNTDLLRSWLTLPPGPWPPDDRTLLGLKPGVLSAIEVEQQALAQMEKLRPHQLVHPDLVTEGMNRLAQSLISLTEEANRSQATLKQRGDRSADADIILDADQLAGKAKQPVVLEAEVVSATKILDAPKPEKPRKKTHAAKARKRPRKRRPSAQPVIEIPTVEALPPGTTYSPAERRKGYRKLAELRRVVRAWERLQPYFAAPSEVIDTPGAVFGFVEAVHECRRTLAIDGDADWFDDHGGRTLTVVRHPFSLAIFRNLVLDQRQEIATDWARAMALLRGRYLGLRDEIRKSKPKNVWGSKAREAGRWLRSNPEWTLALLVVLAVSVAFIRSVGKQ